MKARFVAICLFGLLLSALPVRAGDQYTVSVVDIDGRPVANAVVYIASDAAPAASSQTTTIIDQVDKRFSPRVSAVQVGANVTFPNSDSVSHHVYSFANPNNFELPLYKGETRPSVRFDHPGLVTLGCNIHDSMLGYVLVVETPYFAVTDAQGKAVLPGLHELRDDNPLRVWAPELQNGQQLDAFPIGWTDADAQAVGTADVLPFRVHAYVKAQSAGDGDALSWGDY